MDKSKPNTPYKGRDHYTLSPGETEYYKPCCYSDTNSYGTQYHQFCPKVLERYSDKNNCGCYGSSKNYGKSSTCSCKNLPNVKDVLTGVI